MIRYRAFRNSDPPALVDIWRSQGQLRPLVQPLSLTLLETLVLSKPYFDRQGLIVATDGEVPIGFVHVGFGPNEDQTEISTEMGVISVLMVHPHQQRSGIEAELLARGEAYLQSRGATLLYAGEVRPLIPFYLGLYGGSEMPGVADSDEHSGQIFATGGYQAIDHVDIFHCDLAIWRPVVDRKQMQIRRRCRVVAIEDPRSANWWEACQFGRFERLRFDLRSGSSEQVIASATFRDMDSHSRSWGIRTIGLVDLVVAERLRRGGLATFLLGEALRQLNRQGIAQVEVQTMRHNRAAVGLYEKLGFVKVDSGTVMRKQSGVVTCKENL